MQIQSAVKYEQYTVLLSEGKTYKVLSCLDNEYFDNGIGYTVTLELIGDMVQ